MPFLELWYALIPFKRTMLPVLTNATAAASEWRRSRRYILQATVTSSVVALSPKIRKAPARAEMCQNVPFLEWRKNTYISKLAYIISEEFLQKSRFFRRWKIFIADYQPFKDWKRKFFPLFVSKDPPTALRSASKILLWKCAICWAILPLSGDDADVRERIRHAVSVS